MTNKKILIVEDDKFLADVFLTKLTKEGFNVIQAFNGDDAIMMTKKYHPDLILLDIIMPKKDGFEVLKEIKNDEEILDIPVIIMSNLGQEDDVIMGKKLKAAEYLIKTNISLSDIVKKIKQYTKNDK
jgi:two-component system, OmpR family, response regulator VicR